MHSSLDDLFCPQFSLKLLPTDEIVPMKIDSEVCGLSRLTGTFMFEKTFCCWILVMQYFNAKRTQR